MLLPTQLFRAVVRSTWRTSRRNFSSVTIPLRTRSPYGVFVASSSNQSLFFMMENGYTNSSKNRFFSSEKISKTTPLGTTMAQKEEEKENSKISKQETINSLLETLAKVPTKGTSSSSSHNPLLQKKNIRQDINKAYFPGDSQNIKDPSSKGIVLRAIAGNAAITVIKTACWLKTGSSAMLSEAIHSLVDTGNQAILILGLRQASGVPDKKHQYGYGRAAYFWSLISALGIFWLGAGVTVTHGVQSLLNPPEELVLSWEIWTVLGGSFLIDGWVLKRAVEEVRKTQPVGTSFLQHIRRIKDPFMMAVLLEDLCACTGVVFAGTGIGLTHLTGNPMWDSLASISIGMLLGSVAITLIRLNQRFLLGQSVDPEIERGIRELLLSRPSIDNVYAVQSQWVGPSTFSYKAEVDFDGTYLAAKLLQIYKPVFMDTEDLENDLPLILAWYAEDVTRLVEKEVQEVEEEIRSFYPEAVFIELEPDSKDTENHAIANMTTQAQRVSEREAMSRALAHLGRAKALERDPSSPTSF